MCGTLFVLYARTQSIDQSMINPYQSIEPNQQPKHKKIQPTNQSTTLLVCVLMNSIILF